MINDNFIIMNTDHNNWSFEDYIETAENLADEKQMPVLLRCPYRRRFVVLPAQVKDSGGYVEIVEEDIPK